jgi:hypothetical protein
MTVMVNAEPIRLERCPVTDSRHRIDQASAVSSHSTPLAQ